MIESSTVSSYEINRMYGDLFLTNVGRKGVIPRRKMNSFIKKVVEAKKNTSTGKACFGLWVSIGKELNRDPELVLHRWNNKLSKIKSLDDTVLKR
jgi:hypothetical protein